MSRLTGWFMQPFEEIRLRRLSLIRHHAYAPCRSKGQISGLGVKVSLHAWAACVTTPSNGRNVSPAHHSRLINSSALPNKLGTNLGHHHDAMPCWSSASVKLRVMRLVGNKKVGMILVPEQERHRQQRIRSYL